MQAHGGGRAGHAINCGGPLVADAPARCLHPCLDRGAGVDRTDAHGRHAILGFHQPHLKRGRANAHKDIAAGGFEINQRLFHGDLAEEVIHIDPRLIGFRQHRNLGRDRHAAAQTIDILRVARAHDGHKHACQRIAIFGQISPVQIRPARGAATHEQEWNGILVKGVCHVHVSGKGPGQVEIVLQQTRREIAVQKIGEEQDKAQAHRRE